MSNFKPTASQAEAIGTRGSTVLVSAGAGSGKTKVLTERLMAYITDAETPVDIDSFLIITFTRAAAAELRGRIMDELNAAMAADPGNRRLRRQNALCQRAQIGTIHSFCAAFLRENSHLVGLSPDFKIMDDERAARMKSAALDRVLEKRYSESNAYPGFLLLADTAGVGRDDSRLAELILDLHEKMQSHARPRRWATEQTALLQAPANDISDTPWGAEIISWARETSGYWAAELERVMEKMAASEKVSTAYMPSVSATAESLRDFHRALDIGWDKARSFLPISFPNLGRLMKCPDVELKEFVQSRRKACQAAVKNFETALYADSAKLLAELKRTSPAMQALLSVTLDFDEEYLKDKRRNALVDYSDLEHMTAQLLTDDEGRPTELAVQTAKRYTEIMVDEYQDVSHVQDAIFNAISREGKNLFLVGDVKQSIYRFRLADPGIFTEKYLNYADAAEAGEGVSRRILLQENFRSRREILEAANSVFKNCMSRELGDIDYGEDEKLICGAPYEGERPVPQLLLLDMPQADGDESPDKVILEAQLVASKIHELIDSGTLINAGGQMRRARYGDIAVLLRSANSIGGVYRRVFAQCGVPTVAGAGGVFFSSVEISTAMSMLSIIDNPHQDIPLVAALGSPIFGFSADELAAIRSGSKNGDYYTALCARAEYDTKCEECVKRLEALRRAAQDMSIGALIWQLLGNMDLLAICNAMPDGEHRRANLMELLELAEQFEASGYRGLHRFILWLRRLEENGQAPAVGSASESAVQIMTTHKSKGLEFPIVFISDTARRFNKQDSRDLILVHPELGLGPKVTDLARRVEYPSIARNAIKLRLERETLSEEMRLLYVAMTRAKEHMYITATMKKPAEQLEKALPAVTSPMSPEVLAAAQAPVNWLIYAALADNEHHLKIKLCTPSVAQEQELPAEPVQEEDLSLESELRRRLDFHYAHSEAESMPSKLTATELKGRGEQDEDAASMLTERRRSFRTPDFTRKDKPLTGTERGVATHLVLQYMDFTKAGSAEGIKSEIERLRERRFISEREAEAVNADAIAAFFASPIGERLLKAEIMHREFRFSLLCDAYELFGTAEGEQLLLQGVVDCCFEENGELVIVDYKTDSVRSAEEISQRSEHYSGQLRAYASALGRIFSKPVKECVLYFLVPGKTVAVKI